MTVRVLTTRPSAFEPLAMSLAALVVLVWALAFGVTRPPDGDEGAAGHIWQLLMAGQLPIVGYFAITWLPRSAKPALAVLAVQFSAAMLSIVPVFLLRL